MIWREHLYPISHQGSNSSGAHPSADGAHQTTSSSAESSDEGEKEIDERPSLHPYYQPFDLGAFRINAFDKLQDKDDEYDRVLVQGKQRYAVNQAGQSPGVWEEAEERIIPRFFDDIDEVVFKV